MEKYSKNSLLGQLEENGIIKNDNIHDENGFLPFGILTGGQEVSPFENSQDFKDFPLEYEENENKPPKIIKKRLNELDADFFAEGNYLNIEDEELSRHEKIKKIKLMIKKVDEKIYMLEDSDDEMLLNKLKEEKETLNETLILLCGKQESKPQLKNKNAAIEKLADKARLKEKVKKIEKIIFKICPMLHRNFLVRKALNKLVMLNENAKELMLKKIPYGESESRYNDFTTYLSCANVIHAKLTKKI